MICCISDPVIQTNHLGHFLLTHLVKVLYIWCPPPICPLMFVLGLCVSCRICPPLNNALRRRFIPLMNVPMCTANNFPFMYSKKWYIQASLLISTKHFPNRICNILSGIMIFCREGQYYTANLGHIRTELENPAEKDITISWAYIDLNQIKLL